MHSFTCLFILTAFYNDVIKRHCLLTSYNTVRCGLKQRAVDDAIDQWPRRLFACVDAEGGQFEHN